MYRQEAMSDYKPRAEVQTKSEGNGKGFKLDMGEAQEEVTDDEFERY